MSVRQAQKDIDSAEFAEWVAYHNLEPFSANRTDYILAVIASILANVHRGKGAKVYKPEDFIPQYTNERREPSDDAAGLEVKLKSILNISADLK